MTELHDWSAYLIKAEQEMRELSDGLLHKRYQNLENHINEIIKNLNKTLVWIAENRDK